MVGLNFLRKKTQAEPSEMVIRLGSEGNAADHVGDGWAETGPDFGWMSGTKSEIWLEHPEPAEAFLLELDVEAETAQIITVSVRGHVVLREAVAGRQVLCCDVPGDYLRRKGPVRVAMLHQDAVLPPPWGEQLHRRRAPMRCYGMALRPAPARHAKPSGLGLTVDGLAKRVGEPAEDLMLRFESLGDNCEFGLVQRLCGAEPLGLLRFGAPRLHKLIESLENGFEQLGRIENMEFVLNEGARREYAIRENNVGMTYHTFLFEHEVDESQLLQKQSARLRLLARKLMEDLAAAEKIFVWKCTARDVAEDEIFALHDALLAYGDVTLLWVQPAAPGYGPGTVSWLQPGLLKAHVHRFAPAQNAHDIDLEPWLEVCATAAGMVQENAAIGPRSRPERAPRRALEPQSLLERMAVPGMAHVQNLGDRSAGADGWVGLRGSALAIEGFVLETDPALPSNGLTYQAVLSDGALSERAIPGQFRGTRGRNQPVLGVVLNVDSKLAETVCVVCSATFVDGSRLDAVVASNPCRAASGAALEAFKVEVVPQPKS